MVKKYIDFNTYKKNVADIFEKYCFNMMNNSTVGKEKEHLRKRLNVRLVNNPGDYERYVSKPSFASQVKLLLIFMKLNQL